MTTQELLDKLLLESQKLNLNILERDQPSPVALDAELTSELKLPMRDRYALEELFKYDDKEFIRNAFRAILHREPDVSGLESWTLELRACQDKIKIIEALLATEEGAQHQIEIDGLEDFRPMPEKLWQRLLPKLAAKLANKRYRQQYEQYEQRSRAIRADEINLALSTISGVRDALMTMLDQISTHGWGSIARIRSLEQRVRVLESQSMPAAKQANGAPAASNAEMDAFYMAFEHKYRGNWHELRAHLHHYLPLLPSITPEEQARAVDLGCGRGEWLELLREHHYLVEGVDANPLMRNHCADLGLHVHEDDLLDWLQQQEDNAFTVVSAFHLVEHLPFDVLLRVVSEAYRILRPQGVLILETPNPENLLVASHTFYHDPTHRNPVTPNLLQFTAEYQGFEKVELHRFNPYPQEALLPGDDDVTARINGHFCGPQDYAVVARKQA